MKKELEALERLFQNLDGYDYCDKDLNHIMYGGEIDYKLVLKALEERELYYQALCDIENGGDVRKILERTLT